MPFSPQTRLRILVALLAALTVSGLVGLISLTTPPDTPTAAEPPATPTVPAPAPAPVPLPGPLPPVPLPGPVLPLPPAPTAPPPAVPRPSLPPPACVAPPVAIQRDVDTTDPADPVWPRRRDRKEVVYFETGALPPRYANAVVIASRLWSRSTCVDAVAVPRCPPRAPCSTVVAEPTGGGDEDGDSESTTRGDVRIGNAITLYTVPLAAASDNGALGTVVHEMGHALGLRHRTDPRAIMNATTGDDADPRPDAIDFWNLAVLYGVHPS